jgi:hypothetical protein
VTADTVVMYADLYVARAVLDDEHGDIVASLGAIFTGAISDHGHLDTTLDPAEIEELDARLPAVIEEFKARIGRSAHVTAGAKQLIDGSAELDPALQMLLRDKAARSFLRTRFRLPLRKVIDTCRLPVKVTVPPSVRLMEEVTDPQGSDAAPLTAVSFGDACLERGVTFQLLGQPGRLVEYADKGQTETVDVTELPGLFAKAASKRQVISICQRMLAPGGDRLLLLVLYAAMQSGHIDVHSQIRGQFRVFAIRALMAMNAAESAYGESVSLLEDEESFAQLPTGEQRRLQALVARAAARSGRTDIAAKWFTDLYVSDLSDANGYRDLLGTVFGKDPEFGRALCLAGVNGDIELRPRDWVFIADLLRGYGLIDQAFSAFQRLGVASPDYGDAFVGLANVGLSLGNETLWRSSMERYFAVHGLDLSFDGNRSMSPFGFVGHDDEIAEQRELVTIVMTTFNAADTLRASVASIQAQTHTDWELIIVDDVSTDATRQIIGELESEDARISSILKTKNEGTYLAKNEGIRNAEGAFVTFHDSDDWMHPRRLEVHVDAMDDDLVCSVSQWLRMDASGLAIVRRNGPFTHLNPASTFFRRAALEHIGLFDAVRTGADAEILARIRAAYGAGAVLELESCLGIGLHHENSLTQSGAMAFDEFRYSPVRLAYTESWLRWHVINTADGRIPENPHEAALPYGVPAEIRP